jgi:hypothetical protein
MLSHFGMIKQPQQNSYGWLCCADQAIHGKVACSQLEKPFEDNCR